VNRSKPLRAERALKCVLCGLVQPESLPDGTCDRCGYEHALEVLDRRITAAELRTWRRACQ